MFFWVLNNLLRIQRGFVQLALSTSMEEVFCFLETLEDVFFLVALTELFFTAVFFTEETLFTDFLLLVRVGVFLTLLVVVFDMP